MNIIKSRKYFYSVSIALVVASMASLAIRGINLGADFTGDAVLDVVFNEGAVSTDIVRDKLNDNGFEVISVDSIGDNGISIRTGFLTEDERKEIMSLIGEEGAVEQKNFVSMGPSVSKQLRRNAILAVTISLVAIVLYITWAFRKVSRPVSSWVYGLIAIVALSHDVIIPTGIFSFLHIEIDSLFITALLTVLGFSVHDTIVVFDRVRENLRKSTDSFDDTVEKSVKSTITRSLNTTITTLFALVAIFAFGGDTTRHLVLALIVGIIIGTYSSIFIASPLLVTVERFRRARG